MRGIMISSTTKSGFLFLDQFQGPSATVGNNHLMISTFKGTLYCSSNISVIINN